MPAAIKFSQSQVKEIVDSYSREESINQISQRFGCDNRVIKTLLTRNDVQIRLSSRMAGNESEIVSCYKQGESIESLGRRFRVCTKYVQRLIVKMGVVQRTLAQATRKKELDVAFFDEINTEAKAYFLGYLYADGYNNEKVGTVVLCLQKRDREILETFRTYLQYEKELRDAANSQVGLIIGSRQISQALAKWGCHQAKTFTLTFPDWMSDDLLPHFIRGFIDGDGCFYIGQKTWNVRLSVVSAFAFIRSLGAVLSSKCNVTVSYQAHCRSKGIEYAMIGGAIQVRRVADYLYQDATIYLKRKKSKADSITPSIRGGECNPSAVLTNEQVGEIKTLLGEGVSPKSIALDFPVSYGNVVKIKTGRNWATVTGTIYDPANRDILKGSKHLQSKLTESDIPEIRRLIAGGMSNGQIGKRYSVSESLIYQIKNGKIWRHVPSE